MKPRDTWAGGFSCIDIYERVTSLRKKRFSHGVGLSTPPFFITLKATTLLLHLGAMGNVHTTTCRAFTAAEMDKSLAKVHGD
jgi:hypothetical protein